MNLKILILPLLLVANLSSAQTKWFTLYTDSVAEIRDANTITAKFIADVQKISANTRIEAISILNTTPYLIYYDGKKVPKTVNLPLWAQVIEP